MFEGRVLMRSVGEDMLDEMPAPVSIQRSPYNQLVAAFVILWYNGYILTKHCRRIGDFMITYASDNAWTLLFENLNHFPHDFMNEWDQPPRQIRGDLFD